MRVRPLAEEDFEAVMAVHRRNGIPARRQNEWLHLWRSNPLLQQGVSLPWGWVLETSAGQVVGALANVPLRYEWNGKPMIAAAASHWSVDPEHRAGAWPLAAHFFRQANVDLLLNNTANEAAAQVFRSFRARPVPCDSCGVTRFWITHYPSMARFLLRSRRIPGSRALAAPAAALLWGVDGPRKLRGRRLQRAPLENIVELSEFGEQFDSLWGRLRRRENCMQAVRDQRTLCWRFHNVLRRRAATILAYQQKRQVLGYLVLAHLWDARRRLRRFRVADFQIAEQPQNRIALELLAAAIDRARKLGAHTVEMVGMDAAKTRAADSLGPYQRPRDGWTFFYKTTHPDLANALAGQQAWDPSMVDGDACLF